jgi:hypothetical protein
MGAANVRRRGVGSPEPRRSMQIPSLTLRAFMELGIIREELPMSREPAYVDKRSPDGEAPSASE